MHSAFLTPEQRQEVQKFGRTIAQLREVVAKSATPEAAAATLMNDAQHDLSHDHMIRASQKLNCAKYILYEFCTDKEDPACTG